MLFSLYRNKRAKKVSLEEAELNRGAEDGDSIFLPVCVMQPFCKVQWFAKLLSRSTPFEQRCCRAELRVGLSLQDASKVYAPRTLL